MSYVYVKKHREKKKLEEMEQTVSDFMSEITQFFQKQLVSDELWRQSMRLSHEMLAELQIKKELL